MRRYFSQYIKVRDRLQTHQVKMIEHKLFASIKDVSETKIFMKNHIFAVWDFMTLLKTLQREMTCVTIPWLPRKNPKVAYFLNSIVLEEESDDLGTKDADNAISHFELYRKGMKEIGTNMNPIDFFIENLLKNNPWQEALSMLKEKGKRDKEFFVPDSTLDFVSNTLNICTNGKNHEIAACFLFGREDPIPRMFTNIIENLNARHIQCTNFKLYLKRHIEVDGGVHSVFAEKLLIELCEDNFQKWEEVELMAKRSLQARIKLWDGVLNEIKQEIM
jgi:hypothetical protein